MTHNDRDRPAANGAVSKLSDGDTISLPSAADHPALHAHVVIVSTSEDKAHRRVYLSLHSAEKAVQRAEARGHIATLHLCRLVPVPATQDLREAAC